MIPPIELWHGMLVPLGNFIFPNYVWEVYFPNERAKTSLLKAHGTVRVPRRDDIKKILLIGSGPIIIGQACEFDYSGTQALSLIHI